MTEAYEIQDGEARRLRHPHEGPGGQHDLVPKHEREKAGLMGVLHLLDQIARRDENIEFRRAARAQANVVRGLMGLRTQDYGGDLEAVEAQRKIEGRAQPVLTIDMKTGDVV